MELDENLPLLSSLNGLKTHVGQRVCVEGAVSDVPWQHLMAPTSLYPYEHYFDLPDGFQTVIYVKKPLEGLLNQKIKVVGNVIEIRSSGKKGQKIEDTSYVEYQINVDTISLA